MKKIFIAGGAGYIGTRFCNEFAHLYDITVYDHFWFGDHITNKVNKIYGDIRNIKPKTLEEYDAVLFLGGLSNDPMAMYRPDLNFIENSAIPTYLTFIAKQAGVKRFICASSCSVYGHTKNKTLTESSKVKPSYAYGISKLQCERGISILEDDLFKPIIFRKGTVGGWSQRMRYDLVINTMLMTAFTKGEITVNSPKLWRPLIDIRDVIEGYKLAIECDENISGIFNLSGGNYTIGGLGEIVRSTLLTEGYDIKLNYLDIKDIRNYKVSTSNIEDVLGFESKFTPRDSIKEILLNIDLNNYDFNNEQCYNIQTFKKVV